MGELRELLHRRPFQVVLTLATAVAGGALFMLLHLPIPWLLGPMIAVLIGSNALPGRYRWPGPMRNAGLIVAGYTIGLSLTGPALKEMALQLPSMLFTTVLLLAMCVGIAYVVTRLSKTDFRTALLGSIPGGLSQVLVLAEETKGVNVTVVTVTQVVRLMMIIAGVPAIVFGPPMGMPHDPAAIALPAASEWGGLYPNVAYYAIACVAAAYLAHIVKFPTAYLLGPVIATAVLQAAGLRGPELPAVIVNAAQVAIGAYVGMLLKPQRMERKLRTIGLAVAGGLLLLIGACGLSALLVALHPSVSLATALLSLAPGGMDQMGIIAQEIDADLSMVAGYQLFRMFFILFAVPIALRALFRRKAGTGGERREG